jgi:ribosomal-protein-alanine N-acetyltransferase
MRRAAAFVAAVLRSHALHGRWVHPPSTREQYRASGHMRAGLAAVIRLAFRSYGLHRLEANIQPDNSRSIALVRGLGFELEGFSPRYLKIGGRWRDHERWALTAESWRTLRKSPLG